MNLGAPFSVFEGGLLWFSWAGYFGSRHPARIFPANIDSLGPDSSANFSPQLSQSPSHFRWERPVPVDLFPSVRRKVYLILRDEEERHVEGKAQRSGHHQAVEAVGSGFGGTLARMTENCRGFVNRSGAISPLIFCCNPLQWNSKSPIDDSYPGDFPNS
jgi:hypothetical protein